MIKKHETKKERRGKKHYIYNLKTKDAKSYIDDIPEDIDMKTENA